MSLDFLTRHKTFFGWRMVALAAITGAMTGPGQTIGVSVFIDHFIADLGISRSEVSTTYLIGTLASALVLPLIGNRIDRIGVKRAMTTDRHRLWHSPWSRWLASTDSFALTVGFFAIRLFGQGSLSLASTLAVTHWFDRKRGLALGITATAMSILMSPRAGDPQHRHRGLQLAHRMDRGGSSGVGDRHPDRPMGPHRPSIDVDQYPTASHQQPTIGRMRSSLPRPPEQKRSGRRGSGSSRLPARPWVCCRQRLNFHQISMLGEAGLSATEAAAMFLPQVIGAAVAGVFFGYLADRLTGRILIPIVMGLLGISLLLTLVLAPGTAVILYAISLGAAGGSSRTVTTTLLPRWFGVGHIGAIQATRPDRCCSTALGPVMFSIGRDCTGSYGVAAAWFALIPLAVAIVRRHDEAGAPRHTRHLDAA